MDILILDQCVTGGRGANWPSHDKGLVGWLGGATQNSDLIPQGNKMARGSVSSIGCTMKISRV